MIIILSHYFWSLNKWEEHMQTVVIPTPFTWFGCKYPQIKADSLQLKHILFCFIWNPLWWCIEPKMLELCRCPNIYGPDCIYIHIHTHTYIYIYIQVLLVRVHPSLESFSLAVSGSFTAGTGAQHSFSAAHSQPNPTAKGSSPGRRGQSGGGYLLPYVTSEWDPTVSGSAQPLLSEKIGVHASN